jgi:hypothetical protein
VGRLLVAASSQRLENAAAVLTAKPLTLACWYKPTTSNAAAALLSLLASGTANRVFQIGVNASGVPFVNERGNAGAVGAAGSALTNGSWAHIAGAMNAGTTGGRVPYLNGVAGTTSTASVGTPPVPDRTTIGADTPSVAGTYTEFANGIIAEAAIWNVLLSAAEIAALSRGVRPLRIRPGNLKFYAPIWGTGSPEPDYTAGQHPLTLTGAPAVAAHPPVALLG